MLDAKFLYIGHSVLEKKNFDGFLPYTCMGGPSWSCDLDYLYKLWFPLPYKIWL